MFVYAWMNLTNTITIIILLREVLFVSFIENWCFLLCLGEGTRLLASLVKNGRSVELMRNVVKCQGIPPLVAMVSSEHLVMQNEALVALTLISSTVLGLSSQGRIENCKLSLVLWCFRFHFLMHIWSLTSVEFNEHFWDMVKFSLVFIRFLDKLLRFRGFLHKFMNLKSNFLWWMKWNSWFSYQIFLMESRRCFRGISFWI